MDNFIPLDKLPCARSGMEKTMKCTKLGKMACSACKLVSYCSKECQTLHWRMHKRDCKNNMKSETWKPNRTDNTFQFMFAGDSQKDNVENGLPLWGNIPAIDVINLANNERDATKDFSLAFTASGDLRHVVRTVITLPQNYSGRLNILLNDFSPWAYSRNVTLLLILGSVSDSTMAAEIALHFWFSLLMPRKYYDITRSALSKWIDFKHSKLVCGIDPYPLGSHSTLSTVASVDMKSEVKYFKPTLQLSVTRADAQKNYIYARTGSSSRESYRNMMYAGLRPSHRVAFQKYRKTGILLPFGADDSQFDTPNPSLIHHETFRWLLSDHIDPLEGYSIDEVIKVGKSHGAQPEDIYGCLYFYLSDQLRTFAERIRQFRIRFTVVELEATGLSRGILGGGLEPYGIPSSVKFDRIEVSNILDDEYVGIEGVLSSWGPFLAKTPYATLIGYFMNWTQRQHDGSYRGLTQSERKKLEAQLIKEGKRTSGPRTNLNNENIMAVCWDKEIDDLQLVYDNYLPFAKFLKKKGLQEILSRAKLAQKMKHTIVTPRLWAPLDGPPSALPYFVDNEIFYYATKLLGHTWSERYVEFSRRDL